MPRLGKFEYPSMTLHELLDAARAIDRAPEENPVDAKHADELVELGLVQLADGKIRALKLTHRLAKPTTPDEYIASLIIAMRNIPLFRILIDDAVGNQVAESKAQLFGVLTVATAANPADIEGQIDALWNRYREFLAEVLRVRTADRGRPISLSLEPIEGGRSPSTTEAARRSQ